MEEAMEVEEPLHIHWTKEMLFDAASKGDAEILNKLSKEDLKKAMTLLDDDSRSLLHVAAAAGHDNVVRILADSDLMLSTIDNGDEEGWTPLHSAVSSGYVSIVEILLQAGANVSKVNKGGRSALHYAASKGRVEIAHLLIHHGADVNLKDKVTPVLSDDSAYHVITTNQHYILCPPFGIFIVLQGDYYQVSKLVNNSQHELIFSSAIDD